MMPGYQTPVKLTAQHCATEQTQWLHHGMGTEWSACVGQERDVHYNIRSGAEDVPLVSWAPKHAAE